MSDDDDDLLGRDDVDAGLALVTPFERPRRRLARGTGDNGGPLDDALASGPVTQTEVRRRGCTCPGDDPRTQCMCGRNALLTGPWVVRGPSDGGRAQIVRPLDGSARILRARGPGDVTLGHILPVRAGDAGSIAGRWTLEVAVLARASAAELWWQGYPFAVVRRAAQAPWLARLGARHPLQLVDDVRVLVVVDAFEHGRAEPLELLVAPA